jgi:pilus assembly protein CpaF
MLADRQQRTADRLPALGREDERQLGLSLIREIVSAHISQQLSQGQALRDPQWAQRLIAALEASIWGAGELQELLDDPLVENIDANGADEVWVTYADARGTITGRPVAASDDELIDVVRTLASYSGLNARPFTATSPQLDLRLPDGSRLSAVMSASERPLISIRRNRFPQVFLATVPSHAFSRSHRGAPNGLADGPDNGPDDGREPVTQLSLGTVSDQLAAFLNAAVLSRANIMVAGATDAGKTTLLRSLINCVPPEERLITVESALELGLRRHRHLHPNVAELEEILPGADGTGGVSMTKLVRRSLRMNPSRVIVGEVLGPEVVPMLMAMSQGNDGSLSTIHARSASGVFDRIAVYASLPEGSQGAGLPFDVTHGLIATSVDFVVYVAKNPLAGDRRTVTEVVEVSGISGGRVSRATIFAASPIDGRAERAESVPIQRASALARAGYDDQAWAAQWGASFPAASRWSPSADPYSSSAHSAPSRDHARDATSSGRDDGRRR